MRVDINKDPISSDVVKENKSDLEKIKTLIEDYAVVESILKKANNFFVFFTVVLFFCFIGSVCAHLMKDIAQPPYALKDDLFAISLFIFFIGIVLTRIITDILLLFVKMNVSHGYKQYDDRNDYHDRKTNLFKNLTWIEKELRIVDLEIQLASPLDPEKNPEECIYLGIITTHNKEVEQFIRKLDRSPTLAEYVSLKNWYEESHNRLKKENLKKEAAEKIIKAENATKFLMNKSTEKLVEN